MTTRGRIYIAGKITGDAEYRVKFRAAELHLVRQGWEPGRIVNPVKACRESWPWWRCMMRCLRLLAGCGWVAMLPDWRESRGARIEHRWAFLLGKEIIYINLNNNNNMEKMTTVEMTTEEKAQFEAFQEEQARKARLEKKKEQRRQLQEMTDSVMAEAVAELRECNERLVATKEKVIGTFSALMELRKEVNEEEGKKEQDTFMFTNSEGTQRIRIGYNMSDGYLDQVEVGIAKVKAYLESLAKDEQSKELIGLVLRLLARDQKGNLKASRVMQLYQLAEKSGNEEFREGIRIIQEAYRPTRSKLFIRCSVKEPEKDWQDIGLGIGEV